MNSKRSIKLSRLLIVMAAICIFGAAAHAQFTVTISGPSPGPSPTPNPSPTATPAPTGSFTVSATVAGNANAISKVVFYRNDVPFLTDSSSPYQLPQDQLGQDIYVYRARAYDSTGVWVDSGEFQLTVKTPRVFKMGDTIASPYRVTSGPSRYVDHTDDIKAALEHLRGLGGGTLVLPCKMPYLPPPYQTTLDSVAVYNISSTVRVPSNITIQGEGSERWGRCRVYWYDIAESYGGEDCNVSPVSLQDAPMFQIPGGRSNIRFRDLALYSRSSGPNCYPRDDFEQIEADDTTAIEMNASADPECEKEPKTCSEDPGGNISDVIFENVTIGDFTRGISALSDFSSAHAISNVRIRGVRPETNFRQLFIDSPYAHDWDVQNFNITGMAYEQGAVEIINAGYPGGYTGMNPGLKFLQLNCNGSGNRDYPPEFCVQVEKHGGLYLRQTHHEGAPRVINVQDISGRGSGPTTNPDPIVLEGGIGSGRIEDASAKLYLIGNGIQAPDAVANGLDDARLRFFGGGLSSTVVDCGDVHSDWTDVQDDGDPGDITIWDDLKMLMTHSERNRGSFYADDGAGNEYTKPHTVCPSGVGGLTNIDQVGGVFFDSGVMPTEAIADNMKQYSNVLNPLACPSIANCLEDLLDYTGADNGGSVYIPAGTHTVDRAVRVPRGSQIIGEDGAILDLDSSTAAPGNSLLEIPLPVLGGGVQFRASGIVLRNLKLQTSDSGRVGIRMAGENNSGVSVSSDFHFSRMNISGFETGLYAGRYTSTTGHPMIDGISMKHMTFVNNTGAAVAVDSSNISNWNILDLKMTSSTSAANGWYQTYAGHIGFQDISCTGSPTYYMANCLRMQMSSVFVNDINPTTYVTNGLTIGESYNVHSGIYEAPVYTHLTIRNSDFEDTVTTNATVKVSGKSFITSMNNKYTNFDIGTTYGADVTRLTHCGDSYVGTPYSSGLDDLHPNLWVGVPTPTRIQCGTRPVPWEDAVNHGGNSGDQPLVGNFYDNVKEDFVIYRPGSSAQFLIKKTDGTQKQTVGWGTTGDYGLIGNFYPSSRAQLVIFRPSTGNWWIKDPNNGANDAVWTWGTSGDIPLVGNFLDESGAVTGNHDEIAIYRPSTNDFWIMNPRSGAYVQLQPTVGAGSNIQVGDFLGFGYDQIAQYDSSSGDWDIIDPRSSPLDEYTANLGLSPATSTGDVPVAGKYLPTASGKDPCIQLGIWRPADQKFYIADVDVSDPGIDCGTRTADMLWGSNNDIGGTYANDIPLTINNAAGTLRRPTAYRPTVGAYPASISNGQWWVHDVF